MDWALNFLGRGEHDLRSARNGMRISCYLESYDDTCMFLFVLAINLDTRTVALLEKEENSLAAKRTSVDDVRR